jgi:drug/metabolite transporter (DMT)-like permease
VALLYSGGTLRVFAGNGVMAPGYGFVIGLCAIYCVAYAVHMLSLRMAPASVVAPYYNLEPIVTTAAAALILGKRLNLSQYAGGGLVLDAFAVASAIERFELAGRRAPPMKALA